VKRPRGTRERGPDPLGRDGGLLAEEEQLDLARRDAGPRERAEEPRRNDARVVRDQEVPGAE
jgi:hypothetical protein